MARRIATGIDIGTYQVKMVVVEELADRRSGRQLRILGTGLAESKGLRHGYIVNKEEVSASIVEAKRQAESIARVPIRAAFLAIGGISLDEARATGFAIISRADQEITALDLEKAGKAAREAAAPGFLNRHVLHSIPLEYRIDGSKVLGDPLGMKGVRLEVDYLFVTCLAQHEDALFKAVEDADIEIIDHMASPLAGSYVLLEGDQKMKGCLLANIGAETVSIVVYDEGIPISVKVFPMGSSHITDDIALGLRISLEEAERVKVGRLSGAMYPRKKIDDFIAGRLLSMFALVDKHLKSLGRRGPLPAGIIISGGGAGVGSISDIAKGSLKLPARLAEFRLSTDSKIRDATWAVAYGLALWGLTGDTAAPPKSLGALLGKFFRQFLP
ncbi:cell division protein FtsA [Candidatus Kaiserbacteria bacterium RIFCSPHIGHO2_02_FULL_54_22]|uniref:Cell division protein FtsA n=1 Tax=Candidatus Kaiserbacteria bacterium RIFCSPHIGHO2_02_FULL_54_22 TaxID=1798495 RepID=A0A1F6DLW6_9BACT|nr:MAG: Cell division protein ftsA [Parcubacteria group bacterium GW2011_GWA1_54_9]KKW41912.1 MAG: Cell division protein ftsA [Parcubacteria group bacterium GW2011_GWB1_55_9]OGG62383.1 MAG: cell division protein FtsA [Candidatus Kaiserbacteria bacterium RIFCSPHIGHO2_02_FULL_54_22]OGG68093.1 MAG: cell division protein FtsA [Candidatus Kaiserbacteria bacterium RIFCSPHIGHO2_12_FULL_54_16]OGG90255.1 MAG: cell division protein FtsA [Candidatus Kaiserbacteria bacterium RIFCSPLOWO2_12_FULL_54_10]